MEPNYRHRFPPCPDYDLPCLQFWLEQMAREGLHLDGASGFFAGLATFIEGTPSPVKYRLEAVIKTGSIFDDHSAPTDEAIELAEAAGWEYVCRLKNFDIYRTADPLAPELNTDPQLQAQSLKAVEKRMRGEVFYALFWFILYPLLRSFGPILTAVQIGVLLTAWGWSLLIAQLGISLYRVWFLARIRRLLRRGAPLLPPRNLKQRWWRYRLGHGLHVTAVLGFFLTMLVLGFSGTLTLDSQRQPLSQYPSDPPFPTVADLTAADALYQEQYFGFNDEENTFAQWSSLLMDRAIVWEENALISLPDGSKVTGGLYVEYYDAKSPWIADRLAKSLFQRDRASWNVEEIDLPDLGLDYVRGTDRVFNTVILRKGDTVVRAYFYNTALRVIPWNDWLTALAQSLQP